MRYPRSAALAVVALATLLTTTACDDDDKATATPAANSTPDGGAADAAPVSPADAGTDAGPPLIPLTEWIHDLVTGFGPMSPPDTVDDKHIMDTDDPAAFDSLLQ